VSAGKRRGALVAWRYARLVAGLRAGGWAGLMTGGRITVLGKGVGVVLTLALVGGAITGELGVLPRPFGQLFDRHQAQDAPGQRWGSAAGQPHVVGSSGNRTIPKTLRAKYPLRHAAAAPVVRRNIASVAEPPAAKPVVGFDARTSREVPARRDARTRGYVNADGTETTEFSTAAVNYRKADGSWAPIDHRLVPAGADPAVSGWRTAADSVGLAIAARADAAQLASVTFDGGRAVAFGLQGAKPVAGQVDASRATFTGVLPGVDLRLDAQSGGVKETLVLRSREAARRYVFPLRLTGLTAAAEDGQVVFTDESGRRRAVVPAGVMWDSTADAVQSTGVSYRLVSVPGGPALQMTLDSSWLDDPARRFPVLVDPSVVSDGADAGLVVHGNSSTSGSSELLVGRKDGSAAASYVKFSGLVNQLQGHTIFGAQLSVVNFDSASCRSRPVTVHPVTQSWSSSSDFDYPGPAVGSALTSSSFAYGFIGLGQSRSSCPTNTKLFNLGEGGRKLVQGWADGAANNGLSLRASASDDLGWKKFVGTGQANPPKLFVTHSPYNAKYAIPNPVPNPPVLQNQSGKVRLTVTNLSAETWTPSTYYLAYRAYNATTGAAVTQQRAASLPGNVAREAKVTLDATIRPLPLGKYFLDFTMVRTGGPVFTDEQVPPARIVLEVTNIPPVVQALFPPNGYQAPTLTPRLWGQAVDIDAPAGSSLQYRFEVCDTDAAGNPVGCTTSPYQSSPAWIVTAGRLAWSKNYLWRAFVKDNATEVSTPYSALLTNVPQPAVTSNIAGAPSASQDQEFDPQVGNFSTAAVDASVTTIGPPLTVVRTYNSLDPRRAPVDTVNPRLDAPFGAGWRTQFDVRLTPDDDGSGNVVVSYPDGQEMRFGKNPNGSYAAPAGRQVSLTFSSSTSMWTMKDSSATTYTFSGSGRLTKISDAASHSIVLSYGLDGLLAKAQVANSQTNTAGRALFFTWSGGHVATVSTDPVNGQALTWTYKYTGDLLTNVCAPESLCTSYAYTQGSHYRSAVLDDKPESYWRLGESPGAAAAGSEVAVNLGTDHGEYKNVTLGAEGGVAGSRDTAASFDGTSSYVDLPKGTVKKSRDAAVEMWFKANRAGTGGPLLGYQDKALGTASTIGVPVLYQGADGKLHGQFWNATIAPMTAPGVVNDGNWHHVVLSSMGDTQTLYLDGARAATTTNPVSVDTSKLTVNQIGAAYATSPASWTGWGTTAQRFYNGAIDEVAVYDHPLGSDEVVAHFRYGASAANQLSKVTLPSGKVAADVDYDNATGRVDTYTDADGGTWKVGAPTVYGGDADLRRGVQVHDPTNRFYLYEYDALTGQMIRQGMPTGQVIRDEDKADFTPAPSPTPSPTTSCTTPDPGDPQFCTTIPPSSDGPVFEGHTLEGVAIRSFSYDANGFLDVITNENGETVTLTHDGRGNVTSSKTCRTNTECHTEFFTYPGATADPLSAVSYLPTEYRDGRSASVTDGRFRTTYTYHTTGQLLTQTNPDSSTVRHTYSDGAEAATGGGAVPAGLVMTTTDARGAVTRYGYYQNGDLAKITPPSGLVVTFSYDAIGRIISQTETSDAFPAGVTTTRTYDTLSRPTSVTEPATTDAVLGVRHQPKTTISYDSDGNVTAIRVEDLLGGDQPRVSTFDYDDHNRIERVTDPEGGETGYNHDALGNTTAVVDPNGNRYEYGYTARNQVAEVRLRDFDGDPGGVPSTGDYLVLHSYAYDFAGRVIRDIDAMGRRYEYGYYDDDLLKTVTLKGFHNPNGTTRDFVVESDTYDGAGNLTQQVTGNGQEVTSYTINPTGGIAAVVQDPSGLNRRTDYTYDPNGNVAKVATSGAPANVPWLLPADPQVVSYTYDLAGNLTQETQSAPGKAALVTTHTYDQRGLRTSTTDPRGNVTGADKAALTTNFVNDEVGRVTTATGPVVAAESSGNPAANVRPVQRVGFNTFDEPVATSDPLGNLSRTDYDRLGRPTTTTAPPYTPPGGSPITAKVQIGYDGNGNVTKVTDPAGNQARYGYDRLDRLTDIDEPAATNDDRAVWRYTYTRTGQVLSATDPTGARVQATYDDLDRRTSLTEVERHPVDDNFTTSYGYDDAGNLTSATSPTGAVTTNSYDKVGELTKVTDPSGVVNQYGYDFAGQQIRELDGLGRTHRSDYDLFGRVTAESDLDAGGTTLRTQTYDYDPAGNQISSTDPLGHTTTSSHDAANRLIRQVEPVSDTGFITTTVGYDAAGNRTRFTDGRGNSTIYTVNTLGLPESVVEPSTPTFPAAADRTWTTSYDSRGNPTRLVEPGGVTRTRTFDAANRLTNETGTGTAATPTRTLSYDRAGRLSKVGASGGDNTYTYNDRDSVLTANGPSGEGDYTYDADGLLTRRTDASGTTDYTYIKARLATTSDGITGVRATVGYDAAGAPKTVDYGAGRLRTFGYDNLGRLAADTLKNNTGQAVASISYGYDPADRLTSKTTTGTAGAADNTYAYDQAGRLTSWTAGATTTAYEWDAAGNRTKVGTKAAVFNARNQLQSDGDSTYTYTARGTLASRITSGRIEGFSYDALDRLAHQGDTTYTYDSLDRINARNGQPFAYAGLETNPVADATAIYARDPDGGLLAIAEGQDKRLALTDKHGDVVGDFNPIDTTLTTLTDSAAYDPFGQITAQSTGGTAGNLGYQGDWTDPTTNQINMGARWYNPGTGTFNSRDGLTLNPYPSVQANRYTYANADPLDHIDPTGFSSCGLHLRGRDGAGAGRGGDSADPWQLASAVTALSSGSCGGGGGGGGGGGRGGGGGGGGGGGRHSTGNRGPSAADRAAAARRAALARARAVTAAAKRRAAYAAKHHPMPVPKAAQRPLYSSPSGMVSTNPHVPARQTGVVRDVVNDHNRAVQDIYNRAVQAAGPVVNDVSTAARSVSDTYPGARPNFSLTNAFRGISQFVKNHAAAILGFVTGAAVGVLCGLAIGWTGVGAVLCGALAGAASSLVHDMVEGGHSWREMLRNAAVGGVFGGITGGLGSIAGQGLRAGVGAFGSGGLRAAGRSALSAARSEADDIVGGRVSGGLAGKLRPSNCLGNSFVAGTAVLMADGSHKPIEQVTSGDKVKATDPVTGESGVKPVTGTIAGAGDKHLVTISVGIGGDRNGTTSTLTATDGHPFWVANLHKWVEAKDLRPGNMLRTSAGTYVQVVRTRSWTAYRGVYNLSIDTAHTYYALAGNTPVLVHNCGGSVVRHGPMNEGPLPEKVAENFRSSSYNAVTSDAPTTLYRVYGGSAEQIGGYWTRVKPSGPLQSVIDSALDRGWGNSATRWVSAEIPAGVTFYEGAAAAQGGLVGGGNQVFIPHVDPSWVTGGGAF
jgi:RHS repeat-associated protein